MNKKRTFLLVLAVISFLSFIASNALAMGTLPPTISDIQNKVQAELNSMDTDLAQAAQQLKGNSLTDDNAGIILQKLYKDHLSAIDVVTISADGKLLLIKPDKYQGSTGEDISHQTHFILMKKTHQPVMSEIFKAVEGFNAVSLSYPVFSASGQFNGCVSIVLQPDALIRNVVKQYDQKEFNLEFWAMETDGHIVYDKDVMQVGKKLFTDPVYRPYPDLLKLGNVMTREASGSGTYTFPVARTNQPIKKSAVWTTIGLHGTDWRLVISKTVAAPQ
jgi:hypothetical protein